MPLLVHMKNETGPMQRGFLCSSVDMLPFIYTLALGNESWRTNPNDMVSYLNNRESIFDAINYGNADSRRLAQDLNDAGGELPYVLFSTDEFSSAANPLTETPVPSHAIGFRTVDTTVQDYDANTGMNFCGGGKLGMYTSWLECTTYPNTAATSNSHAAEFEFYDYYPPGNNYGEIGNDAFNSGWRWNSATAGVYLNSYNNIMAQELYYISPAIQGAFDNAFTAYMNYLGTSNGGGDVIQAYPPNNILPPA